MKLELPKRVESLGQVKSDDFMGNHVAEARFHSRIETSGIVILRY